MIVSEPLPHFVDDLLSYLYEAQPTHATLDGVHTHDDLLEDLSRQGVESHTRALSGYLRRLEEINVAGLTEVERLDHRMIGSNLRARMLELEEVRTWEKNPQYYSDILASSLAGQALFNHAPRRRTGPARAVEAAPDAAAHPGGPGQHHRSARHLRQGRPRNDARRAQVRGRRPAESLLVGRRHAPARRPRRRAGRGFAEHRRVPAVPGNGRRAARAIVVPARPREVRTETEAGRGDHGFARPSAGDRHARAARDAGGIPHRLPAA